MTKMFNVINELNLSNSSKHKLDVLKKYQSNKEFEHLLKMTYDKIYYNFYISKNHLLKALETHNTNKTNDMSLSQALDILENISKNKMRGNVTIKKCLEIYDNLNIQDKQIFLNILGRDLRCNINTRQINKIFKNLIPIPKYMRCSVYSNKTSKNIKFPAFIQLKMDGTYRQFKVQNGFVFGFTRSGEPYENPVLSEQLKTLPNGYYIGELTIDGDSRFISNGLINSDNPPYDKIIFTMWDYLSFDDYDLKTQTKYCERFKTLNYNIKNEYKNLKIVESYLVNDLNDALDKVNKWMKAGLEGGILKDQNNVFKDGTSKTQLKIKLCIDADVRITGFTDGAIGTKREGKIGAITYKSDDGKIEGQCSGFSNLQLEQFTKNKESLIGKIMSVQFNDLSQSKNSNTFALSHPRFIEIRNDKTETDTLERILELREMAKELK